jgi:segregation and condensation protein B
MDEGRQDQENQELQPQQDLASDDVTESQPVDELDESTAEQEFVDSENSERSEEADVTESCEQVEDEAESDEPAVEDSEDTEEEVPEADEDESTADIDSDADTADENSEVGETAEAAESDGVTREQIVEALLFSSETPLSASKIANVVGAASAQDIRETIDRLNQKYLELNRSFQIQEIAGGFQMVTKPEYSNYLQQLFKIKSENKLSGAALETLAVIAYKQPVLRAEVEAVRGVSCGEMIRAVMEKDLIKIVGRAEELGRPMLYGTTKKFLEVFGLGSLEDLPKVPELLPSVKHTPIVEGEKKEEGKKETATEKAPEKTEEKNETEAVKTTSEESPAAGEAESQTASEVVENPTENEPIAESVNETAEPVSETEVETPSDIPAEEPTEEIDPDDTTST